MRRAMAGRSIRWRSVTRTRVVAARPLEVRLTLSGPMGATGEEVGIAALELYVR
jgi:hypothetical protein